MNVADALRRAVDLHAGRVLVVCGDEQRTYAEIGTRTDQLANALRARGIAPGDRVATLLVNSIRCVETDFAFAKAGIVRVSINPKLTGREAEYILGDSDARVLVYDASFDVMLAELRPRLPKALALVRVGGAEDGAEDYEAMLAAADPAPHGIAIDPEAIYCLFYTSGTTGRPKGVMLSHRSILHVSWNLLMEIGPLVTGEKILLMQAMSHGAGFFVLPYVMKGGTAIIMRDFDPAEVVELATRHAVEVIKLVPTMLQRMLRLPGIHTVQFPHLRAIVYGASPMPAEPLRKAIEIFGSRLVQIYGQSECPVTLTVLPADEHRPDTAHPERLTSAGRPWSNVEIRIADEDGDDVATGAIGEVVLRGPHLMSGYWKRPEQSAAAVRDGWLRTNDMGRIDAAGMVYLLGRKDEMIVSGGYNIAPREVEDVLYENAPVVEAAVVGEADDEWGQAVVAYVVLRDPDAPLEPLMAHARSALGFKRPKRIHVIPDMPKNSAGKIQKRALVPTLAVRSLGTVEPAT
ncbi:MAG: AMP-binding protein [Casimicrobiaceae bacterium]